MVMSRRRSRPRFVLAILVLIALTLVTLDTKVGGSAALRSARSGAQSALSTVQTEIHRGLRPVGNFLSGAADYGKLKAENEQLRRELSAAATEEEENSFERSQYDQALALRGIPYLSGIPTVEAPVINQEPSNFEATVTIGKGRDAGVAVGQPVVSTTGLAGSVTSVSARSAVVTLLVDPTFTVGVALPAGNVGSATGAGPGRPLRVQVITTGKSVPRLKVGQLLYTSGQQGDMFPAGIPVGRVVQVSTAPGQQEPSALIQPAAGTTDLGAVDVLLWAPT